MAQLTVIVPDATVPRIRAAFGTTDTLTGIRTPATVAEVEAAVRNYIKGAVLEYEVGIEATNKRTAVGQENWNG